MNYSKLLPLLILMAALVLVACKEKKGIDSSTDCFTTPAEGSYADFGNNPLPPGTFGEGSEAFAGRIAFRGNPENPIDTCVERLDDVKFDDSDTGSTRVRMKRLDLISNGFFTVVSGDKETRWKATATLSETESPTGKMSITRADDLGGTWEAEVPLYVKLTLTPEDPELEEVILDTGEMGGEATVLNTRKPVGWAYGTTLDVRYDDEVGYRASNGFVPALRIVEGTQHPERLEHRGEAWGHVTTLTTAPVFD